MSWLSEWIHKIFPGDKPTPPPGPVQATTVITPSVVIPGRHGEALVLGSDDAGVFLVFRAEDAKPYILARYRPDGRLVVHGGPNKATVTWTFEMDPTTGAVTKTGF